MNSIKAIAQYRIRRNGKVIVADQEFDCDDESLIKCGAAVPLSDPIPSDDGDDEGDPTKAESLGGELDAEQRAEAIQALLSGWLASDPEKQDATKWKKDGDPRNKAVDNALGFNVSNDDILPIWAALSPANSGDNE